MLFLSNGNLLQRVSNSRDKIKDELKRDWEEQNEEGPVGDIEIIWEVDDNYLN